MALPLFVRMADPVIGAGPAVMDCIKIIKKMCGHVNYKSLPREAAAALCDGICDNVIKDDYNTENCLKELCRKCDFSIRDAGRPS